MGHEPGTCGFCGFGDGCLGGHGDGRTQHLPSAVRVGSTIDDWTYHPHPSAWPDDGRPDGIVVWCGGCVGGLAHKYQRYTDHNLSSRFTVYRLWEELDAPHWSLWDAEEGDARRALMDDPAIHLEKIARSREVEDMQCELQRRSGFDLTSSGWRP